MRNTLIIYFIFFVSNSSFSQTEIENDISKFKLEFNVANHYTYTSHKYFENELKGEYSRFSLSISSLISYEISDKISVSTGLSFRYIVFLLRGENRQVFNLNEENNDEFYIFNNYDTKFEGSFSTYSVLAKTRSIVFNDNDDYTDGEDFKLFLTGRQAAKFIGIPVQSTIKIFETDRWDIIGTIGVEGLILYDVALNIDSEKSREYGVQTSSRFYTNSNRISTRRLSVYDSEIKTEKHNDFSMLYNLGLGTSFENIKGIKSKIMITYSSSLIPISKSNSNKVNLSNVGFEIGVIRKLRK